MQIIVLKEKYSTRYVRVPDVNIAMSYGKVNPVACVLWAILFQRLNNGWWSIEDNEKAEKAYHDGPYAALQFMTDRKKYEYEDFSIEELEEV